MTTALAAPAQQAAPKEAAPIQPHAWLFALTAGTLAAALYLLTLSANYNSDGMAFVRQTQAGDLSAPLFFQAEHVLYPFVGWLFAGLASVAGFGGGPLVPMQVLNALAGGVAVGAFAFMAGRLLPGRRAVLAVVLLAVANGWWFHSTDAEDQMLANAGLLVALAAIVAGRGTLVQSWLPGRRGWLIVLAMAFAVLVHATVVLALPAILIVLLGQTSWRGAAVLGVAGALILALVMLGIGFSVRGLQDVDSWRSWLLASPGVGVWGKLHARNLWQGAQSLAIAAVYLPVRPTLDLLRQGSPAAFFGLLMTALVASGVAGVAVLAALRRTRLWFALAVWALLFAAFGAYWAPDDFQFWLLALPPVMFLLVWHVPARWLAVPVVALALWNLGAGALPRHDPAANTGLVAARCIGATLGPNDLVIAPGWDWAGDYLPYFTDVNVLSLNDVYVMIARGDKSRFFAEIDRRMAETRAAGGKIYLVRLDTMTADEADFFRRVTGLGPSDFPWQRSEAFRCGTEVVSEVVS